MPPPGRIDEVLKQLVETIEDISKWKKLGRLLDRDVAVATVEIIKQRGKKVVKTMKVKLMLTLDRKRNIIRYEGVEGIIFMYVIDLNKNVIKTMTGEEYAYLYYYVDEENIESIRLYTPEYFLRHALSIFSSYP